MNARILRPPLIALLLLVSAGIAAECPFAFWGKKNDSRSDGGAGGISPSITWLDLAPVIEVANKEADLRPYRFDFSNDAFPMIGGMGYGGSRCGAKIGGGGWFGYKKFISNSRRAALTDSLSLAKNKGDTAWVDSSAHLHCMLAYGGFLIEKNIAVGNVTFEVGGLLGGGAIILGKSLIAKENSSVFLDEKDSTEYRGKWAAAPMSCLDIHTGVSYKLSSFMVVGVDANLLMLHSESGFNLATESFFTLNPGVRLRILFGNLG